MPSVYFETSGGVLLHCNFNPFVRKSNHWDILSKSDTEQPTKVVFGEEPRCAPLGEICWIFSPLAWVSRLICCERHEFRYVGLLFSIESDKVVCRMYDKHIFTEEPVEVYEYVTRVNVNILRTLAVRGANENNDEVHINFQVFFQTKDGISTAETREMRYYNHDGVGDGEYIRFTETVNGMVESVLQNYALVFPPSKKKSIMGEAVSGSIPSEEGGSLDNSKTIVEWNANNKEPVVYRAASFKGGVSAKSSKKVVPMEIVGRQASKKETRKATTYEVAVPEEKCAEGSSFLFVDNFGQPVSFLLS